MRVDKSKYERFNDFWEDLYKAFPAARVAAVQAMGAAVKEDLDANIVSQGVDDMFGHIRNTQEIQIGSRGGYAAVRPASSGMTDRYGNTKTWKGRQVSTRQVTRWLERGHGARKPSGESKRYRPSINGAGVGANGQAYVKGYMFYSWAKLKAQEHALRAADKVLSAIADEIDY